MRNPIFACIGLRARIYADLYDSFESAIGTAIYRHKWLITLANKGVLLFTFALKGGDKVSDAIHQG